MGPLLAAVAVAIGAAVACVLILRRVAEARSELARVRATFERYVSPSVVETILERRDDRFFTGRHLHATVLVCRIWNFSLLVEELTPEETLRYLNEFYGIVGASVQKNRGIVIQFASDGIVAAFGAPLEDPLQEDNATRAALDIVRLFSAMESRWIMQGRRSLRVGVGIASGEAIAGDAGFRARREYAVVGPVVTLAHRLQEATSDINAVVLVSAAMGQALGDAYQLVHVRDYQVRGLRRNVDAYIVRGKRGTEAPLDFPNVQQFARPRTEPSPSATPPPPQPAPREPAAREYVAPERPFDDATFREHPVPNLPLERPREIVVAEPARPRLAYPMDDSLADLDLPHVDTHDAGAAFPDPPPPRSTYEDGEGPPLRL